MVNIVDETQSAKKWHQFPIDAVAIAGNGTGDRLVLLPKSETVWTWDHETGELFETLVTWR